MSIRVKEENQELMLLVLEHSISGSSMKDLQNELDIVAIEQLSDRELTSWINEGKIDDGFTLGAYALYKCEASETENKHS